MKKILKFLLLSVFVISPTVTVIGCGTSAVQISSQDILNSAAGRMQDHIFNMTELKLKEIPNDKSSYESLAKIAKDKITNYYSELVKPGLNWDYPAVTVKITDKNPSLFLNKYGSDVESRINLTAHLTYKNLAADKDIVIKISNDTKNYQEKIDAIGNYLKKYLEDNNNFIFPFKTLFKDDLMSNDPSSSFVYGQIQASLRNSLFVPTKENPIPVIDVEGVDMFIEGPGPNTSSNIYSLKGIDIASKAITGTLKNLTLIVGYESGYYYKLVDKTFNIVQNFTDANNQIATILNQGKQGIHFKKVDLINEKLPEENQTLEKYDPNSDFRNIVAQKIFTFVDIIYPTTKIKGNETWDASRIIFENAGSSPYISIDKNYGYFMVNIKFSFKIDDNSSIEVPAVEVKLNLNNL